MTRTISANSMDFSFDKLIAPISADTFFAEYWEKRPLHISRGDTSYYDGLATTHEIDSLITGFSGEQGMSLSVIGSRGAETTIHEFGSGVAYEQEGVYKAFANGSTVRIRGIQRHLPGGQALAAGVTQHTSAPVRINMYLTPRNSQGFNVHQDGHEVLVVQIKGRKHWNVYAEPVELPNDQLVRGRPELFGLKAGAVRYSHSTDPNSEPPLMMEVVLEEGDFLYIPRGFYHAAYTTDALSMHFTIGAYTLTWHDAVLAALGDVFGASPELRRSLPAGFARGADPADIAAHSEDVLTALRERLDASVLARAVDTLGARVVATTAAPFQGLIEDVDQADTLGMDDPVRMRKDLLYRVDERASKKILSFNGRTVRFPDGADGVLERIEGGAAFSATDLPAEIPAAARLKLVRQLVKVGMLMPVARAA